MKTYLAATLCAAGLAVGQILFKVSAIALSKSSSLTDIRMLSSLFAAVSVYGVTSLFWVYVLQKADLGRVYPIMALAFVLVPLGSHFFFGERFSPQYYIGVFLIISGIVVATSS